MLGAEQDYRAAVWHAWRSEFDMQTTPGVDRMKAPTSDISERAVSGLEMKERCVSGRDISENSVQPERAVVAREELSSNSRSDSSLVNAMSLRRARWCDGTQRAAVTFLQCWACECVLLRESCKCLPASSSSHSKGVEQHAVLAPRAVLSEPALNGQLQGLDGGTENHRAGSVTAGVACSVPGHK